MDGASPQGLLPRTKTGARKQQRPARISIARSSGCASTTRPDPASLAWASGRLGSGDGARGRAGKRQSKRGRRAGFASSAWTGHGWTIAAMHGRESGALRLRQRLLPYNFLHGANQALPGRASTSVLGALPGAEGGRPDHQVAGARSMATARAHPHHLVSAARSAVGHRPGDPLDRWGLLPGAFINTAGPDPLPRVLCGEAASSATQPTRYAKMAGAARMSSLFGLPT